MRKENWFNVLVEIVIVVIGIFLGLAVHDWNEARKDREQQALLLVNLSEELETMDAEMIEAMAARAERLAAMQRALRALEACDASAKAQEDIRLTLDTYQATRSINYLSATYDEMLSTGALAQIQSKALKRSIAYTFSSLGNLYAANQSFRASIPVVDEIVWRHVTFTLTPQGKPTATFELEQICGRREMHNAVAEMIDLQRDGLAGDRRTKVQIDELKKLLIDYQAGD